MAVESEKIAIIEAARRFTDAALQHDDSLFTPGRPIWTLEVVSALREYAAGLAERATAGVPLVERLGQLLVEASPAARQMMAELLFFYLLIPYETKADTKRSMVESILKPLTPPVPIPPDLLPAFDTGLSKLGPGLARQDAQLRYLVNFFHLWKQLSTKERTALLDHPWQLKALLYSDRLSVQGAQLLREALLYLIFPATFESIVSVQHKQRIVERFRALVTQPTDDVDRALQQIRQALRADPSSGFQGNFYDEEFRTQWDGVSSQATPTARQILEGLLPEPESRLAALKLLAASMRAAHAINPGSWAVTLPKAQEVVRLNVGGIESLVIQRAALVLFVDERGVPVALRAQLDPGEGAVATQPIPVDRLAALDPRLHEAHLALVRAAARDESGWVRHHQPAVIAYLRTALGESLPDPEYGHPAPPAAVTASGVIDERAEVEDTLQPPAEMVLDGGSFDRLLDALSTRYLFPPEVVSNYLLALQARRFVILTGISGTGKTQLALSVARHFQPRVRHQIVTEVPNDGVELVVAPYMLSRHLMVLPVRLTQSLLLPPLNAETNSGQMTVQYPDGAIDLTLRKDPSRNVTHLFFKGPFRAWFERQFSVGDRFVIQVVETQGGVGHTLRFVVPQAPGSEPELNGRAELPRIEEREVLLDTYLVVAVRPDWIDNRGLLGYYNPLSERYAVTPFLRLLLNAAAECERATRAQRTPYPFFAILDEMNLAKVEHYFSDLLSCLESGEPLHMHDDPALAFGEGDGEDSVPQYLMVPPNLFITGTVNVDETTYMFSPKVLDRAFTIELNTVDLERLSRATIAGTRLPTPLHLHGLPPLLTGAFPGQATADLWSDFGGLLDGALRETVVALHLLLEPEGWHFGYRVANEIARFVLLAARQAGVASETLWAALDLAILQKVLPKFHGTEGELGQILLALFAFAIGEQVTPLASIDEVLGAWRVPQGRLAPVNGWLAVGESTLPLPRTAAKVWLMLKRLRQQGFTAFVV